MYYLHGRLFHLLFIPQRSYTNVWLVMANVTSISNKKIKDSLFYYDFE